MLVWCEKPTAFVVGFFYMEIMLIYHSLELDREFEVDIQLECEFYGDYSYTIDAIYERGLNIEFPIESFSRNDYIELKKACERYCEKNWPDAYANHQENKLQFG